MLHKDIIISITPSSGTGSQNSDSLVSCLCKLILISPATNTTTYDLKLINYHNDIIYHKEGLTGAYRDITELPLKNIVTIRIENASADELFQGLITVQE